MLTTVAVATFKPLSQVRLLLHLQLGFRIWEGFYRLVLRITKSHCGVMVGGVGQLPGEGLARDVSTQVSLAPLLTSASQANQCPPCVTSGLTFGKELMCKDRPLNPVRNWGLKRSSLQLRDHIAGSTVRAKKHRVSNKQSPWPLVRKRTIPTERPPLVGEF
jgi:hypothetical protein